MNLPKNWTEVKVDQFIELHNLEESSGSLFLSQLERLAILTDQDADEIDITTDELVEYIRLLAWTKNEPKGFRKEIGQKVFKGLDLTLGEFIDLEHYFAEDYISNLAVIASILFRRFKRNEWGDRVLEPYTYNPKDRESEFLELPITDIYGIISEYLKFRDNVMKSYENLFTPDLPEDGEMDEEDIQEEKKESKWSWELLLFQLANEDITKVDQITDLPLIFVFNFLSMRSEMKR